MAAEDMITIGVRVPADLHAKIVAAAAAEDRQISYIVRRILAAWARYSDDAKAATS